MGNWTPEKTADGSCTFFSEAFGEAFHSRQGAKTEAIEKFVQATQLPAKAQGDRLVLLDVCYGLGYNSAAALESIWQINPHCHVTLYGLELDASVPIGAAQPELLMTWQSEVAIVLKALATSHRCQTTTLDASLIIGDARQSIQTLVAQNLQADAIFFDPFSPRKCPQLWTIEFLAQVSQCLAAEGFLATYSRSAAVRKAMLEVGLHIGTIPLKAHHLPHEWSQGTIAAWNASQLLPLSPMEQEHLKTRAAIPYRDHTLQDTAAAIAQRHQAEQQSSGAESTSSWRRRWNIH
jgi:tRNA U34 5-methylaminomethyl-2-thiouridine-forming methyltransferase MnmC